MKARMNFGIQFLCVALVWAFTSTARAKQPFSASAFSKTAARGALDDQHNALAVTATPEGARLRCSFQKLEAHATRAGLWVNSTAPGREGRLHLLPTAVGRVNTVPGPLTTDAGTFLTVDSWGTDWSEGRERDQVSLAGDGTVSVEGTLVSLTRPGLTEEYSASLDGVRQDFVIRERPAGAGDLRLELQLAGARAEVVSYGAKLTLDGSGRELAYSRLRVEDITGHELPARLDVLSDKRLAVYVADANANYPVRIDPTFSDADWVSLNPGMPGTDGSVLAMAADGSGSVYFGGTFTVIGTAVANSMPNGMGTPGWLWARG